VKFGGLKFLETAHVKDVLALLRWAENPRGRIAAFRAARLVPGVGPATAARLLDAMDEAPDPVAAMQAFEPPEATANVWQALVRTYRLLRDRTVGWPAEFDGLLAWYEPQLPRLYEDWQPRSGDLAQLRRIAAAYASRERFLTELTLDPPAATGDHAGPPHKDEEYLILSTIHSAKGQEWKAVQIINVVDGCIPSDLATGTTPELEEERRLLYVAMTRAKDHLVLLVPQRFFVRQQAAAGDRHVYAPVSRFLPESVRSLFDENTWPAVALTAAHETSGRTPTDIAARMLRTWKQQVT
jgi:DNA helicase-2/ATP-dependent DNA helicase PcrA